MPETDPFYFDYAATAPPLPAALTAWQEAAIRFPANPAALYSAAYVARERALQWTHRLAALCGFHDGRLIATSGGTEANNLVIRGVLARHPQGRILVAADSHPSVWEAARQAPDRMEVLPLPADGYLSPADLDLHLRPDILLVSLLHAANETGVVQPAAALADLCLRRGVSLHLDGVQVVGRLPLDLAAIPCRYYTFSAHKFGGPRGFGGLLARTPNFAPQVLGGDQQDGLRAGTENLPGLAGAVAALEQCLLHLSDELPRLRLLAHRLRKTLHVAFPALRCHSDLENGVPGLLSLTFPGVSAAALVADLDLQGFAIAAGSACHAHRQEPSRAILARGLSPRDALSTVRISMGSGTTAAAVDALAQALIAAARRRQGRD